MTGFRATAAAAAGAAAIGPLLLALLLAWAAPAWAGKPTERLTIVSGAAQHVFNVEIADTPAARSRGLMYRKSLAPDAGMLFLSGRVEPAGFWMKNTEIPLDLLFLSRDGRIVDLHRMAQPFSLDVIASAVPVWAVLEVPGGTFDRLGLALGDRVEHPAFAPGD